tara:strand:- start:5847 stop:6002 length:156 start_codon:yes stop_codon:yes gene_type:complete
MKNCRRQRNLSINGGGSLESDGFAVYDPEGNDIASIFEAPSGITFFQLRTL